MEMMYDGRMRIVNWNIEWMNDWFVGGGVVAFRPDNRRTEITDVADLASRVARVIRLLDPDVLTLEEGPSDIKEIELFVNTFLSADEFILFGGVDGRSQKIYALIKKHGEFIKPRILTDKLTLQLNEQWRVDVDGDFSLDEYSFTRSPLIILGESRKTKKKLRLITLHTKSKYIHNGEVLWNNPQSRPGFIKQAVINRRRISAEAFRVRRYLDTLIKRNDEEFIIVAGDFNDGPGIDFFEARYLTHNVTDVLLGSTYYPQFLFRHAFLDRVRSSERYTAIFDDFIDQIPQRKVLIDHILVSPALAARVLKSGIAHKEYKVGIDPNASGRQKNPSDHRPVFADLDI